jgi:GT2 family glycosyltransferase/glycosyltransferase involved in cell wall biosynthesis
MYVKAAVLARVGVFEEEAFGRGFGEENDLCERAKRAGFKVRLCDDVFVWHRGKASFGAEGHGLESKNAQVLEKRQPGYHAQVRRFFEQNPLAPLHDELRFHLERSRKGAERALLFLAHASPFASSPGGTEHLVRDLVQALRLPRAVVAFPEGGALVVAEVLEGEVASPTFFRFPLEAPAPAFCFEHAEIEGHLRRIVDLFAISAVHVHHLLFWPLSLGRVLKLAGIPMCFTSHDYYAVCPNWNLLDLGTGKGCACEAPSSACLVAWLSSLAVEVPEDLGAFRRRHRAAFRELLGSARAVIFPSAAARDQVCRHVNLDASRVAVVEHGRDLPVTAARRAPGQRLRLGVVGEVAFPTKGAANYLELVRQCRDLPVEWHFFGATEKFDFEQRLRAVAGASVQCHGRFARDELGNLLAGQGVDLCVLLPSAEETFSFVLSEVLAAGVPALALRRGALPERIDRSGAGVVVDDLAEALAVLGGFCRDRAALDRLALRAKAFRPVSMADCARAHRELYERVGVLPGRGSVAASPGQLTELADLKANRAPRAPELLPRYQSSPWYPLLRRAKALVPAPARKAVRGALIRAEKSLTQPVAAPPVPGPPREAARAARLIEQIADLLGGEPVEAKVRPAELRPASAVDVAQFRRAEPWAADPLALARLRDRLREAVGPDVQPGRAVTLRKLAEVFEFEVPVSPRARVGRAVTSTKRALMKGLKPFHVELLRRQRDFNLALAEAIEDAASRVGGPLWLDLSESVARSLRPLADPEETSVLSHRGSLLGGASVLAKRSYLSALRPVLREPLAAQRRWNLEAVESLAALVRGPEAAVVARAGVNRLAAQCDPLDGRQLPAALRASLALWREVFRRQTAFNHAVVDRLSALAGAPRSRPLDYGAWVAALERGQAEAAAAEARRLAKRPVVSIVTPVFDTPEVLLRECIESVLAQSYGEWQLLLIDDGSAAPHVARVLREYAKRDRRIEALRLDTNGGISRAANAGLARATGEFVAFLDHDDRLAAHALAEVALHLARAPSTDVLYTDEDKLDEAGNRIAPFFKPGWSPDLLRSCNYVCHFLVARRDLVDAVGGLRPAFDGAQDFDLVLRLSERTRHIAHLPKVLYHWRVNPGSTAGDVAQKPAASDAGRRALAEHLARLGETAVVEVTRPTNYRVRYPVRGRPLVSIIVPYRDHPELLETLVSSLLEKTGYPNFELLLISNRSVRSETAALLARLGDARVRKLSWDHPFNFSAICNFGAGQARGELLLFLNNDVEVLEPGWLEELVGHAQRPEVGAVGPMLVYPDGRVQHAGVVVGLEGFAGHPFRGCPDDGSWTAFGSTGWTRNYLAVTSACVLIRRELFDELGGYDERFAVGGGDVDLCLRLGRRGMRVVFTPHAKLVHHESATRDPARVPEADFFRSFVSYRPWLERGDPFYNPNLTLLADDCSLRRAGEDGLETAERFLARGVAAPEPRLAPSPPDDGADDVELLDHSSARVAEVRAQAAGQLSALRAKGEVRRITWFLPVFHHAFGGVHTVLRFADLLRQRHGVTNDFVVRGPQALAARSFDDRVAASFPALAGSLKVIEGPEALAQLEPCDLAVATYWKTAYLVLEHPRAAARAYFVQDFEPLFFPAGTRYGLAEQTYRFGFYGIFNSPGLHQFVTGSYPMQGCWFEPTVEPSVFHAGRPPRQGPVRVFFYGRPSTDRNGFELGLAALKRLKDEFGAKVEIISAGERWQPRQHGAEGVVSNLGVLPYEKTAELYRRCDVGLCFMFTKHPSYLPLEWMASGMLVVTNDNPSNHWLLEHEKNCLLAQPTRSCVVEQLRRAVSDAPLRARLGAAAVERLKRTTWEEQVDSVYAQLTGRAPAGS